MRAATRTLIALSLPPMLIGLTSCDQAIPTSGTYTVRAFTFVGSAPPEDSAAPHVWINTNTALSFSNKAVTSSLPCSVMIDCTDNDGAFQAAEFTTVQITYDDGSIDRAPEGLTLPLRIAARKYETVNSVAGGRIVKSTVSVISGSIPNVVTRAESFRLHMEGRFIQHDGGTIPFVIDRRFDIRIENADKPAAEVLRDG